jgi:hypothetical protein
MLLVDLLLRLETPIRRYFEVMLPADADLIRIGAADEDHPEKKRLDANIRTIVLYGRRIQVHSLMPNPPRALASAVTGAVTGRPVEEVLNIRENLA